MMSMLKKIALFPISLFVAFLALTVSRVDAAAEDVEHQRSDYIAGQG